MVLLRRVIGDALRARRQAQHRTLRQVSTAANVSLGYLSEIERGQKEASSELLSAICDALGAHMSDLLRDVSQTVAIEEQMASVLAPLRDLPVGDLRGVDSPMNDLPADHASATGVQARGVPAGAGLPAGVAVGAGVSAGAEAPGAAEVPMAVEPAPVASLRPASVPAAHPVPATRPMPAMRGAPRKVGDKAVLELGEKVSDGVVSVTVRRDSPLKTTLLATRRLDRGRESVTVS
jgi:transcriptional regulator with XRE-family HTH domain